MISSPLLTLEAFGVSFGDKVVLADVNFSLNAGITVLMGPVGTGKSTLMRTLAGLNSANSRHRQWGRAEYEDRLVTADHHPALVAQKTRLLRGTVLDYLLDEIRATGHFSIAELRAQLQELLEATGWTRLSEFFGQSPIDLPQLEQRVIAILAMALTRPRLLMVDEPTSGLNDEESEQVLDLLSRIGPEIPLLVVLHNQQQARRIGHRILLMAGGRIQADESLDAFFETAHGPQVEQFKATGSCVVASPDAKPEELADDIPPPPSCPWPPRLPPRSAPITPARMAFTGSSPAAWRARPCPAR